MDSKPIGVFDSGVGGISTLKTLTELMPNEDFIFYGDSLHAPYGDRSPQEVYELSKKVIDILLEKGVKAVVIACNTATSAAKERLITDYPHLPIVGIEPALKEAIDDGDKNILVLGTKLTMSLPKYQKMVDEYKEDYNIYSVACPGLADYVEEGMLESERLIKILNSFLIPYQNKALDSIVLGCTHYPFLKNEIKQFFSPDIRIHEGYAGVTKQLKKLLKKIDSFNLSDRNGNVEFYSSKVGETLYYRKLFRRNN